MSTIPINPFLEGSEEVSEEEAAAAAKALAEEAAKVRARANEIKERADLARARKEAARKAEMDRIQAEIEATRIQVVKTVASIPKASEKSTVRPAPPPDSEAAVLSTGAAVYLNADKSYSSGNPMNLLSLASDFALAAITLLFTLLIFRGL